MVLNLFLLIWLLEKWSDFYITINCYQIVRTFSEEFFFFKPELLCSKFPATVFWNDQSAQPQFETTISSTKATRAVQHCHEVDTHRHCSPQSALSTRSEYFQRSNTCCWHTQSVRRPDFIASERLLMADSLWQTAAHHPSNDKATASTSSPCN